jgi:catechol 2,3-dioxygenase-like lactoylglutathione lyase family enzyme
MNTRTAVIVAFGLSAALAVFAVQAASDKSPAKNKIEAEVVGVSFLVADLEKSVAFYKLLGLEYVEQRREKPNRAVYLNMHPSEGRFRGSSGIALHESKPSGEPSVGNLYNGTMIAVTDVRAVCKRLADAKMPCYREPTVTPHDRNAIIAFANDPDGRRVTIIQPAVE